MKPPKIYQMSETGTATVYFEIPGEAVGKGRPRFSTFGGFKRTYDPKKTVDYENWVKTCYMQSAAKDNVVMNGYDCYYLSIVVIKDYPKSFPATEKKAGANLDSSADIFYGPTTKPDLDNIAKSVMDALNGIAYPDDSKVTYLTCSKKFANDGKGSRVKVTLVGHSYRAEEIKDGLPGNRSQEA